VVYPTSLLAMLIFIGLTFDSIYLGGTALNGYIRSGQYFVCEHSYCVEVSSSAWRCSYWLGYGCLAGFILTFAEMALFINLGDIQWR
jgi:hypothetical protein